MKQHLNHPGKPKLSTEPQMLKTQHNTDNFKKYIFQKCTEVLNKSKK